MIMFYQLVAGVLWTYSLLLQRIRMRSPAGFFDKQQLVSSIRVLSKVISAVP